MKDSLSKVPLVAVIDDHASVRNSIERLVKSLGLAVESFASGEEFLRSNRVRDMACLILDVDMPGMGGLQLQSHLASTGWHIPVIFVTASPDAKTRAQALQRGALDFLHKPTGEEALLKEIRSVLKIGGEKGRP